MNTYKGPITSLEPEDIFVFGSNPEGRHGAGAALWARNNAGAIYGIGQGLVNQSYAIITKDLRSNKHPSISRDNIMRDIGIMYMQARVLWDKRWFIAYSGDGINLNGYKPIQMAEMFAKAGEIPNNIHFEAKFADMVGSFLP